MEPIDVANTHPLPFHPAWFALGFPLFWCLISFMIGHTSGWGRMHERYGGPPGPVPPCRSFQAGRIGGAKYNGVLRIAHDPFGLYLSVIFLFRVGHPPLFIPWSAIGAVSRSMELWMERVRFTVGHPVITTMELPLSAVKGSVLDPASASGKVPQAS
ncbi:MAG: hypothetical protein IT229_07480 [Flavobacteriales bacterium]|nr:hypothetical protein [Flavobacteriales bacterium]